MCLSRPAAGLPTGGAVLRLGIIALFIRPLARVLSLHGRRGGPSRFLEYIGLVLCGSRVLHNHVWTSERQSHVAPVAVCRP
jgi:hypothetical protein